MNKRTQPDWRYTEKGMEAYRQARCEAQTKANATQFEYGIEANHVFKTFHVFMLPAERFRSGHELRCEVVRPDKSV